MRTFVSMLIVAAAVVGLCSAAPASATRVELHMVGGWKPIQDVNDPHIQELGNWAVSEHVKQADDGLSFSKVVSGEEQVVSGINYKLVIEVTNNTEKSATYEAEVHEGLTNARRLLSFKPSN